MMRKGPSDVGNASLHDDHDGKIVSFSSGQEQAEAAALSRYWDARLQGRPAADAELDPELRVMVHLLEHYREVTGPVEHDAPAPPLRRPAYYATLALIAAALLLFASNTLVSPRSWLLSSAQDPDWIPWVSDDWLGRQAPAAGSMVSLVTMPLSFIEGLPGGA